MDSLRGKFGYSDETEEDVSWDDGEDDGSYAVDDSPPGPVGQDERRMQVRAYNFWAGLLGERSFPSVEDIEPDNLPEFAGNSVLLDFTGGIESPAIAFLGERLAGECGHDGPIDSLDDVPARSLLSRITDHYMQILANEAPIGFEAEFINHRDVTILYRGILLPFSTDDETIDFIYGVINWKEVADQLTTDELLLEIDQALEGRKDQADDDEDDEDDAGPMPGIRSRPLINASITRWADGPDAGTGKDGTGEEPGVEASAGLPGPSFARLDAHLAGDNPALDGADPANDHDRPAAGSEDDESVQVFDPLAGLRAPEPDEDQSQEPANSLHDCLAEARQLAAAAHGAELRSRAALYRAVGRAYDVSIAARSEPETYQGLLEIHDIAVSPRAPMTPVVKLVFGADYDKSRLAEYAAVLAFAHREEVAPGALADRIETTEGGLKAIVAQERALRRADKGTSAPRPDKAARIRARLDTLDARPLDAIPATGADYALCVIRRGASGEVAFLGEIAEDERLLARAAKHLVG